MHGPAVDTASEKKISSPAGWLAGLLCLLSLSGLVIALARMTITPEASEAAGQANLTRLWPLWLSSGCAWLGLSVLWWHLQRGGDRDRRWGGGWPAILTILAVAVAARVLVLGLHQPALSDDIYRYIFDGNNLASGTNPYLVAPESRQGGESRWPGEREVAGLVNNPELHTIYLPTSLWYFSLTARAAPPCSTASEWASVYRASFVLLELVTIGLILWLLRRAGRSVWWASLYAWHPLAITEIAGSGHQESVGLVLLMTAVAVWTFRPLRVMLWTAALAASAMVKPIVVPLAALMLQHRAIPRPSIGRWAWSLSCGVVVCLLMAAPLWFAHGGEPLEHLRQTATRFSLKWAHFGSVYEPILWLFEVLRPSWTNDQQEQITRLICTVLLMVCTLVLLGFRHAFWMAASMVFLAMVLLSPAVHPWYLLWALVLMPMSRSRAVWAASLTLPWGYAAWRFQLGDDGHWGWGVSPWLILAAYLPVYGALIWDIRELISLQRRGGENTP